jgi:hypothetical protein
MFLVGNKTLIFSLCIKCHGMLLKVILWSTGLWHRCHFTPAFLNLAHIISVRIEKSANQWPDLWCLIKRSGIMIQLSEDRQSYVTEYIVKNKSNNLLIYIFWRRKPNAMNILQIYERARLVVHTWNTRGWGGWDRRFTNSRQAWAT